MTDTMLKRYSIEEVYELLGEDNKNLEYVRKGSRQDIEVDGFKVYKQSLRYATFFTKGTKCVCCGKEGTYFQLDESKDASDAAGRRHFNLYAEDGTLMTKDHILPRSLGGQDVLSNMQTMCCNCNKEKGNVVDLDIEGIIATPTHGGKEQYFISTEKALRFCANKCKFSNNPKLKKQGSMMDACLTLVIRFTSALETGAPYVGYTWTKGTFNLCKINEGSIECGHKDQQIRFSDLR